MILTRSKKTNASILVRNSKNSMLAAEKRISIILILISLSFLLLTVPVFIMENLDISYYNNPHSEIVLAVAYALMYLNHVINFFFYCSLGPNFRNEVKKLFPCIFRHNKKINPLKFSHFNTVVLATSTIHKRSLRNRNDFLSSYALANASYKRKKLPYSNCIDQTMLFLTTTTTSLLTKTSTNENVNNAVHVEKTLV